MKPNNLKTLFFATVMIVGTMARADVFNMPDGQTSLQFVTVDDPGNAADVTKYGAVGYTYQIGKFEVTAAQYCEFLNTVAKTDTYGLFNVYMSVPTENVYRTTTTSCGCNIQRTGISGSYSYSVAADWANRPVNFVSFWDACRFANWLQNGQPTGLQDASTTEDGAYTLNGYLGDDGRNITRNPGVQFFLPSYDEWYKAAFYKSGGKNAGYWMYPTQSNNWPISELPPGHAGAANWTSQSIRCLDHVYHTTEVGAYVNSPGPYGTFDQAGNVWERNETVTDTWPNIAYRGVCGGSYYQDNVDSMSIYYGQNGVSLEASNYGFRIASIPEPSTVTLLTIGFIGLMFGRLRRENIQRIV